MAKSLDFPLFTENGRLNIIRKAQYTANNPQESVSGCSLLHKQDSVLVKLSPLLLLVLSLGQQDAATVLEKCKRSKSIERSEH